MEEKKTARAPHNIILQERRSMTVTGVTDVDSFDEQTVVLNTEIGELLVKGYDLRISKIDVESGELTLDGELYALSYSDQQPKGGLLSRLFR
ncbi:MAG TPA: sporulation protein YabP [Firmicutes bacterium]|nr:sporulation protein YabP [Bacillota bacterium]